MKSCYFSLLSEFSSNRPGLPLHVENTEKSSSLSWVELYLTLTMSTGSCSFSEVEKQAYLASFIYDSLQIFEESCQPRVLVVRVTPCPSAFQAAKERNHLICFIASTRESSVSFITCSVISLSKPQFSHMQSGNTLLGELPLMGLVWKWLYNLGTMYIWRNGCSREDCQTVGRREERRNLSMPSSVPNHSRGPGQSQRLSSIQGVITASCTISQGWGQEAVRWEIQAVLTHQKILCVCRNIISTLGPSPSPHITYPLVRQELLETWVAFTRGCHGKADMTFLQWGPVFPYFSKIQILPILKDNSGHEHSLEPPWTFFFRCTLTELTIPPFEDSLISNLHL